MAAGGGEVKTAAGVEVLSRVKTHEGTLFRCSYISAALGGLHAKVSVFLPLLSSDSNGQPASPLDGSGRRLPHVFWLSGLTCTDENFVTKAGAFRSATEHGVALVIPDTSPRDANVPGEDEEWTLGTGASFYVDATEEPWRRNYRMYSYITEELPNVVEGAFPALAGGKRGLSGHSMGGHGALVIGLRNPTLFDSISAFAAICNPTACSWGQRAFGAYLGAEADKKEEWKKYDATELVMAGRRGPASGAPILLDQGDKDGFLEEFLLPQRLVAALKEKNIPFSYNVRTGYDHSYYYVSSFISEHIAFHAKHLHVS